MNNHPSFAPKKHSTSKRNIHQQTSKVLIHPKWQAQEISSSIMDWPSRETKKKTLLDDTETNHFFPWKWCKQKFILTLLGGGNLFRKSPNEPSPLPILGDQRSTKSPRFPNKTCCATNFVKANNAASKTRSSLSFVEFLVTSLLRVDALDLQTCEVFGPLKYAK